MVGGLDSGRLVSRRRGGVHPAARDRVADKGPTMRRDRNGVRGPR